MSTEIPSCTTCHEPLMCCQMRYGQPHLLFNARPEMTMFIGEDDVLRVQYECINCGQESIFIGTHHHEIVNQILKDKLDHYAGPKRPITNA